MKQKFFIFACLMAVCVGLFGNSVFASSVLDNYPPLPTPEIFDTSVTHYYNYVLLDEEYVSDILHVYSSDTSTGVSSLVLVDEDTLSVYSQGSVFVDKYRFKNGSWEVVGNRSVVPAGSNLNYGVKTIKYNTLDIVDSNGNVVFPAPSVPLTLAEAVQGGLETLQTKTHGTMMILTACGIGLLVSLMALVLLPKVLYKFL